VPAAIVLALRAGPITHLCFAGRYPGAPHIVRIFCIAALILPVSSVTDAAANGAGWLRRACAAAVVGGTVGTAMSLYLPHVIGIDIIHIIAWEPGLIFWHEIPLPFGGL